MPALQARHINDLLVRDRRRRRDQPGLLPVQLRERDPAAFEDRPKPGLELGVDLGLLADHRRDRFTRQVVGCRSEPAGRDDEVHPAQGAPEGVRDEPGVVRDAALVAYARTGCPDLRTVADLRQFSKSWREPRFPLSGGDLTALGIAPGPAMGSLLKQVEDWWMAGGFVADREGCLAELERRRLA